MEKTFEEACVYVRAIMEGRWRAAGDEEKARILEREKRAIMGYEEEILDYQKTISEILREEGLGTVPCPAWYRDAAEGVFAELYGLAGLTPWVYDATPAYRDSSSAKLIGDRLYCLIDGKSVLQPQRISRDRRAQLRRCFPPRRNARKKGFMRFTCIMAYALPFTRENAPSRSRILWYSVNTCSRSLP